MRGRRCIGGRRINLKEIREMVEVGGRLTRAERGATCRGTEKTNVLPFAPRYQVGPCGTDSFHPPSLSLSRHHPPPLAPSRRRSLDAPQSYTTSNISNYILNTDNFFSCNPVKWLQGRSSDQVRQPLLSFLPVCRVYLVSPSRTQHPPSVARSHSHGREEQHRSAFSSLQCVTWFMAREAEAPQRVDTVHI